MKNTRHNEIQDSKYMIISRKIKKKGELHRSWHDLG
jgi:hypothetical protein